MQRLGSLDPVSVEIDKEVQELSLEKSEDGPKIASIVRKLKVNPNPKP